MPQKSYFGALSIFRKSQQKWSAKDSPGPGEDSQPHSSNDGNGASTAPSTGSMVIPDDIILEISSYLSPLDLLQTSITSSYTYILLTPLLYTSIDLSSGDIHASKLERLASRPDITRYIKAFVVRPNNPSGWANDSRKSVDEHRVATIIEEIASQGSLKSLQKFLWHGLETPIDTLWLALRLNCPNLRNIGASVGPRSLCLDPESHLFDFRDLRQFSLFTVTDGRWSNFIPRQDLPPRLWAMLLMHSPHLSELTMDASCNLNEVWPFRRLVSGRWPRLRKLAIGNIYHSQDLVDEYDITQFLQAHLALEEVASLSTMSYSGSALQALTCLPKLHSFSGKLMQLKNFPASCSLHTVRLTDWFSPAASPGQIVTSLPTVRSLSIYINPADKRSRCHAFYNRILQACPSLTHFEVSSTSGFSLDDFAISLQAATNIESFIVTRVHKVNEEDITQAACRIASHNPHLREFTIREVLSWDHEDQLNGSYRTKNIGSYIVDPGGEGLPRRIRAREARVPALGNRTSKSFIRDLL